MEETKASVAIKKRNRISHSRKNANLKGDDSDSTTSTDRNTSLLSRKTEARKKKSKGIVFESELSLEPQQAKGTPLAKRETIESMISNQFATQSDSAMSSSMNHEKLMEKYVEDKISANRPAPLATEETPSLTKEQMIYRLPENLRVNSVKPVVSKAEEIGMLGGSSGLVEVALPVSYKLANIEETNAAKQERMDQRKTHDNGSRLSSFNYRFQTNQTTVKTNFVNDQNSIGQKERKNDRPPAVSNPDAFQPADTRQWTAGYKAREDKIVARFIKDNMFRG